MSDMTYDEILEFAQQLTEVEQLNLISQLATQLKIKRPTVKRTDSLYGKYTPKNYPHADDEVEVVIRESRTAWENDLKDLFDSA